MGGTFQDSIHATFQLGDRRLRAEQAKSAVAQSMYSPYLWICLLKLKIAYRTALSSKILRPTAIFELIVFLLKCI